MVTNNSENTYIAPTVAREVTAPSQPAFYAFLNTEDSNVTGDGSSYKLGSGNVLLEEFDQNADFNTNGTFTSPVTGRYMLFGSIKTINAASANSQLCKIETSNRNYIFTQWNPSVLPNASDFMQNSGQVIADMDAADIATITCVTSGTTKIVDIAASAASNLFQGFLLC